LTHATKLNLRPGPTRFRPILSQPPAKANSTRHLAKVDPTRPSTRLDSTQLRAISSRPSTGAGSTRVGSTRSLA